MTQSVNNEKSSLLWSAGKFVLWVGVGFFGGLVTKKISEINVDFSEAAETKKVGLLNVSRSQCDKVIDIKVKDVARNQNICRDSTKDKRFKILKFL